MRQGVGATARRSEPTIGCLPPSTLKIDGDKARMSGVTTLDRTAFGVGQGEWQATDQIPAEVKVSIQLTATR